MKTGKKRLLAIILAGTLLFNVSIAPASAFWPDVIAAGVNSALNIVLNFIKEVIWAAAKKAVIKTVTDEVLNTVGSGANGNPQFITDWRKTLETEPREVAELQVKNFFSQMGNGMNSNYVSTSGSSSSSGSIISNAQKVVLDASIPKVVNLGEYGVNDSSEIFIKSDFRAFMAAYGSSGKNIGNQTEAMLAGYAAKAKYEELNKKIASTQAAAYGGYSPSTSNGQVTTPGSTVRDIVSHSQSMSFQSLANAKSIGEVVASLVTKAVSNAVHKGIGKAKENASKTAGGETYTGSGATAYGNIGE